MFIVAIVGSIAALRAGGPMRETVVFASPRSTDCPHAMSYLLLILEPPEQRRTRSEAEGRAVYGRMLDFGQGLKERGLLVASESLKSHADAARVQVRGGRAQIVDGPFAEAKEMVGGFFLLDCRSRDEALAIAAQCPAAEWATVEVRALAPCYEDAAQEARSSLRSPVV
jgi:hypothetical protein